MIDPVDVRFFLSGQLGVWSRWRDGLGAAQLSAMDALLRYRPRRLAKESGFRLSLQTRLRRDLLPRYRELEDRRLLVIEGVPVEQVLADALSELGDAARERWRVPPVAQGGRQYPAAVNLDSGGGWQEFRRNTYWIPEAIRTPNLLIRGQLVWSSSAAPGALVRTDSTPLRAPALEL